MGLFKSKSMLNITDQLPSFFRSTDHKLGLVKYFCCLQKKKIKCKGTFPGRNTEKVNICSLKETALVGSCVT